MMKQMIILLLILAGCAAQQISEEDAVRKSLVGTEIEYGNLAGNTLTYVVNESDIISVEKISEKEAVWKVRVGNNLSWYLYLNENHDIIRIEQLFMT